MSKHFFFLTKPYIQIILQWKKNNHHHHHHHDIWMCICVCIWAATQINEWKVKNKHGPLIYYGRFVFGLNFEFWFSFFWKNEIETISKQNKTKKNSFESKKKNLPTGMKLLFFVLWNFRTKKMRFIDLKSYYDVFYFSFIHSQSRFVMVFI